MSEDRATVFSNENRVETAVYPHDVFVLTDDGRAQIKSGGTQLPADALGVLVMLDGKRTVGDIEQKLSNLPPETLRNLIRSLLAAAMVRPSTMEESGALDVDFAAFFAAAAAYEPGSGAQASASREAIKGSPRLERDGYYVSIARHAVKPRKTAAKPNALIVEDDPDMSVLVQRLLEKAGFGVVMAASRKEVGAKLRGTLPDVILLDIGLPDGNGFDILDKLKRHAGLKAIPVVILTADAAPESIVRGLASGADGYVTKPFDHPTLVRGVRAVLGT